MERLLLGISLLLICIPLFGFAWRLQQQGNARWAIGFLLLGALALRLFIVADPYLHPWDERYHALVAKNLIQNPLKPVLYEDPVLPYDFRNWGGNHVWLHKQPLPLWCMAASMSLFGVHVFSLRLPSLLLSLLSVWLTYLIGKRLFSPTVAFVAAFLHAIHGLVLELTGGRVATDHIDLFFLFFIELGIYLAILSEKEKRTWAWPLVGVTTGLAILVKWLPALLILLLWLIWRWERKDVRLSKTLFQGGMLTGITIAVFLPWQVYIHQTFPQEAAWEQQYNLKHLFLALEGHDHPLWFHWNRMRLLFGEMIYLALPAFVWFAFRKKIKADRLALLTWIIVPFLFFTFARTKMQAYTLFTAPALFLVTSLFWRFLGLWRRKQPSWRYWIATLVLFFTLALPIRYSLERLKPFSQKEWRPAWSEAIKNLDERMPPNTILFHTDRYIEAMFYNKDLIAYPYIPDNEALTKLLLKGNHLYIANPPHPPDQYPPGVAFLRLPE